MPELGSMFGAAVFYFILALPLIIFIVACRLLMKAFDRAGGYPYPVQMALVSSVVAFVGCIIYIVRDIAASKSSTAAIGLIFLPFIGLGIGGAVFLVVWSVLFLACLPFRKKDDPDPKDDQSLYTIAAVSIILLAIALAYVAGR
jgi:hypothetical protein